MRSTPARCSGFTLIELVISASLMAMIIASAYVCLRGALAGRKLVETRTDALQAARVAMALLSADLRCACPLSKEYEFLGMHRTLGDMAADNLDFGTHNYPPKRPREGDFCETSYFADKNPETGLLSLWRRRDSSPDDQPLAGGSREEIVPGLRGVRFEYYDGFEWFDEWGDPEGRRKGQTSAFDPGNLRGMPEAVRITLWIEPGATPLSRSSQESSTNEPPLVFQTVARLNLTSRSSSATSGSSDNSSATGASGGTTPQAGTGARKAQ